MKHLIKTATLLGAFLLSLGSALAASYGPGSGLASFQCAPYQIVAGNYPTGGPYTAGADGIIVGANANDSHAALNAGCKVIGVGGNAYELLGRLVGANMNVTTDQSFVWLAAPNTAYRVTKITCTNASTSLTTAVGGVYTAASKGGTAIVANTQAYSNLTGATLALDLTIAATPGVTFFPGTTPPILALTTAQGAAATADCYVFGQLGQ